MKLLDLEPTFLVIEDATTYRMVDDITTAQGISFLCPRCFEANGGPIGTHQVQCWFLGRGVPDAMLPGPGRWEPVGTGYADLTMRAGSSSILLESGCRWHGFVTSGLVTSC